MVWAGEKNGGNRLQKRMEEGKNDINGTTKNKTAR